jgi:hypothetical protein
MIVKHNESAIIYFKNKIYGLLWHEIKRKFAQESFNDITLLPVPTCFLDLKKPNGHSPYDLNNMVIDSTFQYAVLKKRNKLFMVASRNYSAYDFITVNNQRINYEAKQLRMIDTARKYSSNPFFVYFFDDEKGRNDLIGFFNKKGGVTYFDDNLKSYKNTDAIVAERYGSLDKYIEIHDDIKQKERLMSKIVTVEDEKKIIAEDYNLRTAKFPNDTAKNLNLFISNITRISNLTKQQQTLLSKKIVDWIRLFKLTTYGCGIPFYGKDIAYQVESVLTRTQYNNYIRQSELDSWLSKQTQNKIFYHIMGERKIPTDSINREYDLLIKKIFKSER